MKTETSHTPGPWWKDDEFVFANGKRVADCTPNAEDEIQMSYAEAEANANLIAAAPDLLTACEDLLEQVSRNDAGIWLDVKTFKDYVASVTNAVIAKAKGQSRRD